VCVCMYICVCVSQQGSVRHGQRASAPAAEGSLTHTGANPHIHSLDASIYLYLSTYTHAHLLLILPGPGLGGHAHVTRYIAHDFRQGEKGERVK
jgi:hypothetical protein